MLDQSYLDAIKEFEGFAPQASWDYKQHSNGYGTKALYPGEKIDKDTAEQRFSQAIAGAAAHVDQIAPNAPPGARAALVSLTYNAGPGWTNSGLGELVKAGDWNGASQRLLEYNKAGGEVNPGLVKRRTAEAQWFGGQPMQARAPTPASFAPGALPSMPMGPSFAEAQPQRDTPSYWDQVEPQDPLQQPQFMQPQMMRPGDPRRIKAANIAPRLGAFSLRRG